LKTLKELDQIPDLLVHPDDTVRNQGIRRDTAMKYAAVGFLAIVLLTLGASAQIPESDKDRGQATGEQTLLILRQRATNFQDITGSCDKSELGKRCLALVKLDAWDKCTISIVQDGTGAQRSTYECFWSDKDQNRTLTFYATTAINFHTAALSAYKNARITFPTLENGEAGNIVGLIRIMDGQDVVGDLALIHGDDGSTSVGLWIMGAR
jgi:hypothetical protein